LTCGLELAFANEQRQDAPGDNEAAAIGKMASKRSDGAQDHDVGLPEKVFSSGTHYIDIRQCKCARNFLQEGGFLVI